jgi:hypothetical protein
MLTRFVSNFEFRWRKEMDAIAVMLAARPTTPGMRATINEDLWLAGRSMKIRSGVFVSCPPSSQFTFRI